MTGKPICLITRLISSLISRSYNFRTRYFCLMNPDPSRTSALSRSCSNGTIEEKRLDISLFRIIRILFNSRQVTCVDRSHNTNKAGRRLTSLCPKVWLPDLNEG
ncbi:hypothetical protein NPIL_622671 [Nephila pilipes]|uniref:Uncharacterized protein n=1 Tax=Nephila pilipes TaxID=299642 RepID=A0A8X6N212_NEPPI|nr:hypothetical protein NPIL_622671 [Nephila pilipes]